MDFDKVMALFRALQEENVKYILVGGVAVNLHGISRNTQDVDLFVTSDPDNVARLKRALKRVWNDPAIDEISAEDLAGQYSTIRYGTPDEDMVVDILARLGEAWQFDDLKAQSIEWQGVRISLATPETLVLMKRNTVRPLDKLDAALLREKFGIKDK